MFDALLFRPIFNLLAGIYAIIPGNDFGVAIILFTVLVRFAMWPLVKKQLHQTKIMRKIQPEIKEMRKKNKGNRQAESMALMELYKRNGVSPFTSIGLLLVQLPIFIALFSALRGIINDPQVIVDKAYGFMRGLPQIESLAENVDNFDPSFLGFVNVTDYAYSDGAILWTAMAIALAAGVFQFLLAKQLRPEEDPKKKRKTMREVMREAKETGKEPDMSDVQDNTARRMGTFMPILIVVIAAVSPAGLAIYFASGGMVGYVQQKFILTQDVKEMEEMQITTTVRSEGSATKKKSTSRKKG